MVRCTMHDVGECRKQHQKKKSSTGLEPAISRFVGGCLIHWATKTPQGHQHPQHTKSQSDDKHTNYKRQTTHNTHANYPTTHTHPQHNITPPLARTPPPTPILEPNQTNHSTTSELAY